MAERRELPPVTHRRGRRSGGRAVVRGTCRPVEAGGQGAGDGGGAVWVSEVERRVRECLRRCGVPGVLVRSTFLARARVRVGPAMRAWGVWTVRTRSSFGGWSGAARTCFASTPWRLASRVCVRARTPQAPCAEPGARCNAHVITLRASTPPLDSNLAQTKIIPPRTPIRAAEYTQRAWYRRAPRRRQQK